MAWPTAFWQILKQLTVTSRNEWGVHMANEIVVNRGKMLQIRSRLAAMRSEIRESVDVLDPGNLAVSRGAGARALSDLSVATVWLAASLSYCAGRCDAMLAKALEEYEQADREAARRIQ